MCEISTIYSDVLRLFLELGLDIGEAFQQRGIERAAFPVQDHPHGGLVGERLFVAALTGQGVVHIGQETICALMGMSLPLRPSG